METGRETLSLSLNQMEEGAFVIFELPGFSTAATGAEQQSLDALRGAGDTSHYLDRERNTLWLKVVAPTSNTPGPGGPAGNSGVAVSR